MNRRAALAASLALGTFPAPARAKAARRIVSLIPSLTEDLFALGAGDRVVAVSQFTDYPPAARALPQVASFASVDAEAIVALRPDLVVGIAAQAAAVEPLRRMHLRIALFNDDGFDDIFSNLERLGTLAGRTQAASELIARLRAQTARLVRPVDRTRHPSVFVVLGVAPIFTVGRRSFISTLIGMAGGRNAARLGNAYADYSPEALLVDQPDVVIADPAVGLRGVVGNEPWRSLSAIRRGAFAEIPNPAVLLRPGPRYNEGLEWLIGMLRRAR